MFARLTSAATLSATLAAIFFAQPTSSDKGKLMKINSFIYLTLSSTVEKDDLIRETN